MGLKLDKVLISLTGVALVASGTLGMKFQKESGEIKKLRENLSESLVVAEKVDRMIDLQKELETARMENLKQADGARIGTKTQTRTETTVIPGKTVAETTKVKSSGGSSTSSSSKTTKSS